MTATVAILRDRGSDARARPAHFTVSVSGDLLIRGPIWRRARAVGDGRYDFGPLLAGVRPYVAGADLAICHVEFPMLDRPPRGFPIFSTPVELAGAIRATGWDACDTASNHSVDRDQKGVDSTGEALDRAGIRHTGSFASAGARATPLMLGVKGVKVALLAYTRMTNGHPLPYPWSVNLARGARIVADVRRARARGADAVIVNVHWGGKFLSEPSPQQVALARRLAAHGVTALVGQGPHVVQPIRRVRGMPVVFSDGSLISDQGAACCPAATQDGLIALLHVVARGNRARVARVTYVPTYVRHPGYTVVAVGRASREGRLGRATARASYRRTVSVAGRARGIRPAPGRIR
jgi:poly-gamma-glutamate synthesis protein (capsule biosynthesis protein)